MIRLHKRKKIIFAIILSLIFIWGQLLQGPAILSNIQYNHEISDMSSLDAYIIDITTLSSNKPHIGTIKRVIHVRYKIDGIMYQQEFIMIVDRIFQIKKDLSYSVGDNITIYYEPENPRKIVYPNSAQRELQFYEYTVLLPALGLFLLEGILDNRSAGARLKRKKHKEQDVEIKL